MFTRAELKEAAAHNPFDPQRRDKEQRCQLMFLIGEPEEKNVAALMWADVADTTLRTGTGWWG